MKTVWIPRLLAVGMLFAAAIVGSSGKARAIESASIKVCVRPGADFRAPYVKGPAAGNCPTDDYYHDVFLATTNENDSSGQKVCVLPATDWRAPYNKGPAAGGCPSEYATVFVVLAPFGEQACLSPGVDVRAPYNKGLLAGDCPLQWSTVFFQRADV